MNYSNNYSSKLLGHWKGFGEMLINPITKRMGKLPIELEIKKNGKISGKIGEASLKNVFLTTRNFGFELQAELDNYVKKSYQIDKDRIVMFFSDSCSPSMLRINFQLITNFFCDLNPMFGGVNLKKL